MTWQRFPCQPSSSSFFWALWETATDIMKLVVQLPHLCQMRYAVNKNFILRMGKIVNHFCVLKILWKLLLKRIYVVKEKAGESNFFLENCVAKYIFYDKHILLEQVLNYALKVLHEPRIIQRLFNMQNFSVGRILKITICGEFFLHFYSIYICIIYLSSWPVTLKHKCMVLNSSNFWSLLSHWLIQV